jgi:Arc/MetJ-type ribon-helix-helix transcriptional regulator
MIVRMNFNLSPESEAWLRTQVQLGHFASLDEAIDYAVKLAALRETLHESIADPRRYSVDEVRANLKAHFSGRTQHANAR